MTIKRGKKLDIEYQNLETLKKNKITECPLHANQECILKRIKELKSLKKVFPYNQRQTMGCLVARISLRDRQKGKISDQELESFRAPLN